MKRKVFKFLLLLCLIFQVSCAGIKIVEDRKQFKQTSHIKDFSYDVYIPYYRYVTIPIDIDHYCNGKEWKDVYVSGSVLGGVVTAFTLGVVHPQKIEATCLD